MEGGTLRFLLELRARNVPTGTDFSLGVSLSFSYCGWNPSETKSEGAGTLSVLAVPQAVSDGSDWWHCVSFSHAVPTQSGYSRDTSLSRLRLYYLRKIKSPIKGMAVGRCGGGSTAAIQVRARHQMMA